MNILITGITGTLGQAVSRILLKDKLVHIFGYSRDEKKQAEIPKHERLTLILGDVRDQRRLIESTRNVDIIMHFAALKRVDTLENNPEESIQTNVEGTINVLGAQRANRIRRVVLSSTDKACKPINVYGYCKALSEKLILRNQNNVVVRYGNVLASRGSAVVDFMDSILAKNAYKLTNSEMTRFFIKIEDAAQFVVDSAFAREGGLKIKAGMKACYIKDLADVLAEVLGHPVPDVEHIGLRAGEKLHEDLYHEYECGGSVNSFNADHFSREELRELLRPIALKRMK